MKLFNTNNTNIVITTTATTAANATNMIFSYNTVVKPSSIQSFQTRRESTTNVSSLRLIHLYVWSFHMLVITTISQAPYEYGLEWNGCLTWLDMTKKQHHDKLHLREETLKIILIEMSVWVRISNLSKTLYYIYLLMTFKRCQLVLKHDATFSHNMPHLKL
ncbi:hypothetical protein FF38_03630 [Lucilia cuprina]|uniref:Uncharacterized protein n=1 Tax=Lucilia cuprina TaxID=7375 RepID=A0A0L0CLJ5_LUCCU|nr:hypothetical protein FF38_03630 [Lucilia cuprina]